MITTYDNLINYRCYPPTIIFPGNCSKLFILITVALIWSEIQIGVIIDVSRFPANSGGDNGDGLFPKCTVKKYWQGWRTIGRACQFENKGNSPQEQ